MPSIIIHGAAGSTFVRAARMACIECGVSIGCRCIWKDRRIQAGSVNRSRQRGCGDRPGLRVGWLADA